MLRKHSFSWTNEAREAFQSLKQVMVEPSVMALPDFSKLFTIGCDVSGIRIGAVLMQEGQPLGFLSQALKGKALFLSTYEELLALVLAIQKWRKISPW